MTKYAASTSVSEGQSKTEIEKTLTRYGATQFAYGWDHQNAVIAFAYSGRQVRFVLPMPNFDDFIYTDAGRARTESSQQAAYDQARRQRWRAMLLVIKAKLEAVSSGIVTFEQEFLAYTTLPSGQTVGEWIEPQITQVYATGQMPALLPGVTPPKEISS